MFKFWKARCDEASAVVLSSSDQRLRAKGALSTSPHASRLVPDCCATNDQLG